MGVIIIKTHSRESAKKAVENMGTLSGRYVVDKVEVVSKNYRVTYHKSHRKVPARRRRKK